MPDCYRQGTFWIRPMDRWFAVKKLNGTAKSSLPNALYLTDVFVWLPRLLLPLDFVFKCIFCEKDTMGDDGWNSNPVARRVVSLDSCYYILTKRLRCGLCRKGCNMYDEKILAQLPVHLRNEFPAFLTHRSGIDKNLLTLIRSGIAQGLTPHSWERILQELHLRNRDLAEQTYLHALKHCPESRLPESLTPFSSFSDKSGYAGFSPSRYFISSVYVEYMSYIKPHQDQAMAAVPLTIGHADQSFKVIKYIARLNGVRVFGSLWSITNEFEQIRQMIFTPTKHLHHGARSTPLAGEPRQKVISVREREDSGRRDPVVWSNAGRKSRAEQRGGDGDGVELRDALHTRGGIERGEGGQSAEHSSEPAGIVKSLHEHGHQPISFMYTDNVQADKQFFEQVVPTLRANVDHTPTAGIQKKYPAAEVPNDLVVRIASSIPLIDAACLSIMSDVGDETTGRSRIGHFPAAMMQIVVDKVAYLLQIYHLNNPSHVPESLKALLFSPRVIKVGHNIQGNIDTLSLLWDLSSPFKNSDTKQTGCIDIGILARSKGLVSNASLSFQNITEAVLRRSSNTLQEVRCSDWCRQDINRDQKEYAIRNAWLALEIYTAISHKPPAGARLSQIGRLGEKVTLRNGDTTVAHGFFAEQPTKSPVSFGDPKTPYINLSRTKRALITVQKIVAPSFISHYHHCTLQDMGSPPFDIVVDLGSLIVQEEHTMPEYSPGATPSSHPISISTDSDPLLDSEMVSDTESEFEDESSSESDSDSDLDDDDIPIAHSGKSESSLQPQVVDVNMFGDDDEYREFDNPELDALIANYPEQAASTNRPIVQPTASASMPTRTLQDVWHEMDRLNKHIDKRHSLGKQFARWLRDAILVPDKIDKARVEAVLKKGGITWDQAVRSKPEWVWQRVRRYIPPPPILESVLSELFKTHATLKCARKQTPLFNHECHKAANAMLEDVRRGWLSDPPGFALYNRLRTDRNGLTIWHSNRGTNSVEGGIHTQIKRHFKSLGASVEMSVALLSDFCYRKNVESGSLHREGVVYNGHYDPWIEDDIDITYQSLPFDKPRRTRPGYINVSLFKPTHESFIVTALPKTVRDKYNIPPYDSDHSLQNADSRIVQLPLVNLSAARTNRYEFLAATQDTKFALTPIHTNEEYSLFSREVRPGGRFASTATPNFKEMAKWWSSQVDGKTKFYKLPEHFATHYKTWTAVRTELTTIQLTERDRAEFMDIIRSDAHTSIVLDESFSPVVQGRKSITSSVQIAVKNRRHAEPVTQAPKSIQPSRCPSKPASVPDPSPFLFARSTGPTTLQFTMPTFAAPTTVG
ncbi:hypothetical protein C8R44DRAFT_845839 [Mycena epipterygia]|nr:hypothetical protein C8R44DRAFT_845839 [Mycena epipterygia]